MRSIKYVQRLSDETPLAASGTVRQVNAGQSSVQILPSAQRADCFGVWSIVGTARSSLLDEYTCALEFCFQVSGRHESVMTDLHETGWEHVKKKSSDEFLRGNLNDPLLSGVVIISCEERNQIVAHAADSLIRYCNPVRVLTYIPKDLLRTGKGSLDMDVPFLLVKLFNELLEYLGSSELLDGSPKDELPVTPSAFEEVDKFAPDLLGESVHGNKKVVFGGDPSVLRLIEATCGDNQVQVWMKEHVLVPGVQDGGKANLGLESFPSSGQFKQGLGCGLKEH